MIWNSAFLMLSLNNNNVLAEIRDKKVLLNKNHLKPYYDNISRDERQKYTFKKLALNMLYAVVDFAEMINLTTASSYA